MSGHTQSKKGVSGPVAPSDPTAQDKLIRGSIFPSEGRIGFVIGQGGPSEAIPFEVTFVYPATSNFPGWADMRVAGRPVRIDPDIVRAPYFRLADVVHFAHFRRNSLSRSRGFQATFPPPPAEGETFVFWLADIGPLEVVMIETATRLKRWGGDVSG